ncbi:hypothetical protein HOLleu_03179 [Holothuria leucospilota]|uniref:Uncharacterized protein n=1 Tax=Holothuria leucospilota TaxID=206669 RepID=A0A9Q1CS80_HOLLE|nr:hypothetical protein HOLleu_03179 [Holothuria leucospilota]
MAVISHFIDSFSFIFSKIFQESVVPEDWRNANVTPIFKKGQRSLASNYRPVSLTSLCSKSWNPSLETVLLII